MHGYQGLSLYQGNCTQPMLVRSLARELLLTQCQRPPGVENSNLRLFWTVSEEETPADLPILLLVAAAKGAM